MELTMINNKSSKRILCLIFLHCLVIISILFILTACADKKYNLVMHNVGKLDVRDAKIIIDEKYLSFCWLTPSQKKIHLQPTTQLTDKFDARWARGDGKDKYNSDLSLVKPLPILKENEWYEVVVEINDDNKAALKVLVCIPPYGPCN